MRETTMMRNSKYIAMALGVAVLLAGCSAKSPTAPKPTPAAGFTISLTPQSSTAKTGDYVLVVAQVNSGSGNAPDGTAVTFLVSGGHFDAVDGTGSYATQVIRTTSGGRASVSVTSSSVGLATIEGRVPSNSAQTTVSFGVGPTPPPGKITITSVIPNQGGPEGGDRVVITGSGFIEPLQVAFVVDGQPFLADVVFVATGGTSMTVVTPRVVSSPPSTVDQVADVAVQSGPNTAVLKGGFTYLAAIATPEIYVLSPNAGPFEGGTRVTITGKGFQTPVQVTFDDIQAQVVASNYTEVVCISPSITPTAPDTVITKQVTVTNIKSGKASNSLGFRYGVTMFISSFSPMEGPADAPTTVTIFGQGFVAPVTVVATAGGLYQWDVLSVAGTEIVTRSKPLPESARTCGDVPATLTVTNVNSNTSFTATNPFTYRAIRPLITSVQIDAVSNVVQQYVPVAVPPSVAVCSTPWSSHTVTIKGSGFQQGMTVSLGPAGPVVATLVDANTLTLAPLPDLTSVGLNQIQCTTGAGACGSRFVPTQVSVTVNNPHNGCSDTLNGAFLINPCDQSCLITGLTTLSLGAVVGTPQVGSSFSIPLTFTPTPLSASATVDLTYVGFTATPASVTIPPSSSPYTIIVTPTSAGSGNIIASVGGGSCTVTAASGLITVLAAAPTVTSVAPATGLAAGSTPVTVSGTNFQAGATVTFGGVAATGVIVVNSTTITCTTPAGAAGAVNVVVRNPDAQTGTLVNGFTYT
jgi:hypothetical protein